MTQGAAVSSVVVQFVLPLDVVVETCSVCCGSGSWIDLRCNAWSCFACSGSGVVSFESFDLVAQ